MKKATTHGNSCSDDYDRRRSVEKPWRTWYATARWQALARAQLATEPLCRMCAAAGRVTAATTCDHIMPHRGDPVAFWGGPFASLCATCHSSAKQRQERGRPVRRVGNDGWPV